VVLLGIACAGYLFRPLGWPRRLWGMAAGMLLVLPPQTFVSVVLLDLIGFGLGLALVVSERLAGAPETVTAAARRVP
jgi:hypothetical protein